jgi:hypothetical protein
MRGKIRQSTFKLWASIPLHRRLRSALQIKGKHAMIAVANCLRNNFLRFGLQIHSERGGAA